MNLQDLLLGNRPLRTHAVTRVHQDMVPAGTQGRLVRAGESVHQLLTEDVVTLFDFTLSPDGHKALLMTRRLEENGYRLVEVDLPGPAAPLLANLPPAPVEPGRTITADQKWVTIGGIELPVRDA